ncbi:MAG: YcjF family protein [Pseudorhizobium sp.]
MTPPDQPTDRTPRRPGAYEVFDDPPQHTARAAPRVPRSFENGVVITPEEQDPFLAPPELSSDALPVAAPRRRKRFSFVNIALAAFGTFLSLAFGLWADRVVRDLFSRADWLGYAALTALAIGVLAVLIVVAREVAGILRLSAVQSLKAEAEAAAASPLPAGARVVVASLSRMLLHRAETAKGRAVLDATRDEIIDGLQLIDLAERELLAPLDRQARALILNASKRVSVVTAISPRAIVDLAYVVFEVSRLVRSMAELYGGRPGRLGLLRLLRDVIGHLAVTGSIAVGDGLAQQVLGHGVAARLSKRLGEGVINGLLTARIGIAAMDLCRPLPFRALRRPGVADFISDIAAVGRDRQE